VTTARLHLEHMASVLMLLFVAAVVLVLGVRRVAEPSTPAVASPQLLTTPETSGPVFGHVTPGYGVPDAPIEKAEN